MQDEKYSDAVEWYTQCIDYRAAKNKAEEAKRKQDEAILQSLGLEANSRKDIYTLGNEIPYGLVKRAVLYDDFSNITNNYRDKTEYTLTYAALIKTVLLPHCKPQRPENKNKRRKP